jgi:GDP-4-dehydro-6-deoxy-D-mannose reductase
MARSVLVTGAAGFAGGHLLSLLRQDGPVEGWYRPGVPPPATAPGPAEGVSWRAVDLRDARAVDDGVRDLQPAAIYHLAGAANQGAAWANTDVTLELNAWVTHVLLRSMARHAADARVLVTTSAAIYAPSDAPQREDARVAPTTPYGVSKLAQEMVALQAARDERLDVVVVRPFNHVGPGQDLGFFAPEFARQLARIEAGLEPGPMRVGNLSPRRDLCDVRDTVRAYRLLMQRGTRGEIYNVCRGEAVEIGELLDMMRRAVATPVDVVVAPEKLRPVDVPLLIGDHTRLTSATGWQPELPLDQTMRDILAEQRAMVANPRL